MHHLKNRNSEKRTDLLLGVVLIAMNLVWNTNSHAQGNDSAIAVSAVALSELVVNQRLTAPATVMPANRAQVAAQVSAQIQSVKVDVGDIVKQGDILAELNARDYALILEQAEATLSSIDAQIAQASDRLKRARELSGSQYISADDLLSRQTDVSVLSANRIAQQVAIRMAKNNVAKTRIIAPFDAAVVSRGAQRGSFVVAATPMFELVQLNNREVEAQVASDIVDSLGSASEPRFVRSDKQWMLKLLRITPVVDSESGTQRVRFGFVKDVAPIGSSGQLHWSGGDNLLPADMILQRGSQLGVFVVNHNKARFHALPDAQEGRPAVLNLPSDTLIVTNGRFKLQDNQAITVSTR